MEQVLVKLLLRCIEMLASNLESNGKILFTTYTKNLAEDIKDNLRKICSAEEMKRIDIINLDAWVSNFLRRQGYEYQIVYDEEVDKAWRDAIAIAGGDLSFVENFYKDEWVKVVQAQEVYDKVSYCKASRIGRGVRLDRKVRMQIWDVFDEYQNIMNEKLQRDVETAMYECRKILENKKLTGQYTSIVVDEGQDLVQVRIDCLERLLVMNTRMIFLLLVTRIREFIEIRQFYQNVELMSAEEVAI